MEEVLNKYGFEYQLKPQQTRIINSVVEKQNIIGILPTGFGKSDTFIIPPLLLDQMYPLKKHISLVISPLRSLMFNQQRILKERGIDVGCIMRRDEMLDADKQKILNGQCSIVFTSPESIMMEPWRGMLRNVHYKERLILLVCDEAHCIVEWGDDFRPEYKKNNVLRSLVTCPWLILTATATEAMMNIMLLHLLFEENDITTVATVPDRPNIVLHYKNNGKMKYEEELDWYLNDLSKNGVNAKKVIIYCRSILDILILEEFSCYTWS